MSIKVGQWVRTQSGLFHQVKEVLYGDWIILDNGYGIKTNDIKVADTPQELVQVGDFIIYQQIGARLNHVRKKEIVFQQFYKSIVIKKENYNMITAIYTPNSNGDYIKQWSVNK